MGKQKMTPIGIACILLVLLVVAFMVRGSLREPEKIVLRLKRGTLTVEGENLSIGRYAEGDLLILGDIRKFEVESL